MHRLCIGKMSIKFACRIAEMPRYFFLAPSWVYYKSIILSIIHSHIIDAFSIIVKILLLKNKKIYW
jgi:hypothetical protein